MDINPCGNFGPRWQRHGVGPEDLFDLFQRLLERGDVHLAKDVGSNDMAIDFICRFVNNPGSAVPNFKHCQGVSIFLLSTLKVSLTRASFECQSVHLREAGG